MRGAIGAALIGALSVAAPLAENDKTYWFVAGIGKVRETTGNGTSGPNEELTSYSLER